MISFQALKSGTDVRGVAMGEGAALTQERGVQIGRAAGLWLIKKTGVPTPTVAIGRDSRLTGEMLLQALADGMVCEGCRVLDTGLSTTPAMFQSLHLLHADAAVMVTASHLPFDRNGYKFILPTGGLSGSDIAEILALAGELSSDVPSACLPKVALLPLYADTLTALVQKTLPGEKPLSGMHVVVDAGHGAGGFYADWLESQGANTSGSQFLTPDGRFPAHIPNPEAPAAMASLCEAVLRSGATLGVLFDADCDRAGLATSDGTPLSRNRLIALTAGMLLANHPGASIVTDSVTSFGLTQCIERLGGHHVRAKRGYRNVIGMAQALLAEGIDCPLAMETSGHAAFRENAFLDDGMYLATRLIIETARQLAEGHAFVDMLSALEEPKAAQEIRIPILAGDIPLLGKQALERAQSLATANGFTLDTGNPDGLRMWKDAPTEWFLLRASVHDPLLVLNVESARADGLKVLLQPVMDGLQGMEIDQNAFLQAIV